MGGAEQFEVTHMQFNMWPNYGVVENVEQLARFVREVESEGRGRKCPLVVHCSGGVGRSGAFSTVYSLYCLLLKARDTGDWSQVEQNIEQGGALDLRPLVGRLMETRHPWMVEGEHQYKLAYQTLVDIAKGLQDT